MARRTAEQIEQLLKEYGNRGELTRRGFCERHGLSASMLDYYMRQYGRGANSNTKFVRVKVERAATTTASLALVLRNGRRIECAGNVSEAELSRLIRIGESA